MWLLRPCKFYNGIERHMHDCYRAIWYCCENHTFLFKLVMLVQIRITILWEVVTSFSGKFYNLVDFGRENPIIWVGGHSIEELLSRVVLIIVPYRTCRDRFHQMRLTWKWYHYLIHGGWDLAEWLERLAINAKVATFLGSIPSSSDTVDFFSGRWTSWITYIKRGNKKIPLYVPYVVNDPQHVSNI